VSAPAPGGEPLPVGYPRVLYFCANTNVGFVSPAILGRLCFRSLDGGTTWQASQVFGGLLPTHPQCGLSGEDFTAVDGYYPEPSSNGTLYLLVSCGGRTYLARSTDEAASFPIIYARGGPLEVPAPADSLFSVFPALGTGPQLRIDPQDNMYLVYPAVTGQTISKLFLRISQDRGLSWSRPLDITPPGVSAILRWAVAERGLGNLAVTYVARRQGASTWDGYVSETNDALDALRAGGEPLFWSGVANREPLMYADTIRGAGNIALGEGQLAAPYPSPLGIDPAGGLWAKPPSSGLPSRRRPDARVCRQTRLAGTIKHVRRGVWAAGEHRSASKNPEPANDRADGQSESPGVQRRGSGGARRGGDRP
jgi:hypothetical protein